MGTKRIHNFGAGPAVLPVPVLEEASENMLSLGDLGHAKQGQMKQGRRSNTFRIAPAVSGVERLATETIRPRCSRASRVGRASGRSVSSYPDASRTRSPSRSNGGDIWAQ